MEPNMGLLAFVSKAHLLMVVKRSAEISAEQQARSSRQLELKTLELMDHMGFREAFFFFSIHNFYSIHQKSIFKGKVRDRCPATCKQLVHNSLIG